MSLLPLLQKFWQFYMHLIFCRKYFPQLSQSQSFLYPWAATKGLGKRAAKDTALLVHRSAPKKKTNQQGLSKIGTILWAGFRIRIRI